MRSVKLPLKLSHFPLFKFKITLKGLYRGNTCLRGGTSFMFFKIKNIFKKASVSDWFDRGLIARKLVRSQSCLSVLLNFRSSPEAELFDPSARWLCTKIKHFLYFYSTPAYPWSLYSIVALSSFSKLCVLYPPAVWKRRKWESLLRNRIRSDPNALFFSYFCESFTCKQILFFQK